MNRQRCLDPRLAAAAAALAVLSLACGDQLPEPPLPENLGNTDPAIVELFEGKVAEVRGNPRDSGSWQRLGMVYHAHGRLAPALECYRQSLMLAPNNARSHYFLALAEQRLGRIDEAVASLRRVTELDPGFAPAHWRLGLWLLDGTSEAFGNFAADRIVTLRQGRAEP